MQNNFSHFPTAHSDLNNHQWAKLIYDSIEHINLLLEEAPARDVVVNSQLKRNAVTEHPIVSMTISERIPHV